jgi:lipopolysaccharide transport system permease protein
MRGRMAQPCDKIIPLSDLLLPWKVAASLRRHGWLIQQFTVRNVQSRYRGSYLGVFLSLLRPLAMLALFTIVFGFIFQSSLGPGTQSSRLEFVLALFCGLVFFDCFAESLSAAPMLVLSNPNYVTKVVFPLEILPVAAVGAALAQLLISMVPLLIAVLVIHGSIPLTALYLPLVLLPLLFLSLGLAWFFASLGVFVRDINALIPVLLQIILYASAIFYPLSKVPPTVLPFLMLNPLVVVIDQARNALLWGRPPDWSQYALVFVGNLAVLLAGYAFFMRTKRAFADVM